MDHEAGNDYRNYHLHYGRLLLLYAPQSHQGAAHASADAESSEVAFLGKRGKLFFATPFWRKLQNKNGENCISILEKIAGCSARVAEPLPEQHCRHVTYLASVSEVVPADLRYSGRSY